MSDDEARLSRARGMRRRGLIALGVTVMAAAFVLTFGLMRKEHGRRSAAHLPDARSAIASARHAPPSHRRRAPPSRPRRTPPPTIATPVASQRRRSPASPRARRRSSPPTTAVAVTTPRSTTSRCLGSAAQSRRRGRAADQDQLSLKMKPRSIAVLLLRPRCHALALLHLRREPRPADEAKRHFTNGVHLFEDRNFAGALVEFEASFKQNPTAAALQNIAVCQKGLFRYADAIATLERMLRDFRRAALGRGQEGRRGRHARDERAHRHRGRQGHPVRCEGEHQRLAARSRSGEEPGHARGRRIPHRRRGARLRAARAAGQRGERPEGRPGHHHADPLSAARSSIHAHDSQAAIAHRRHASRLRRVEGPGCRPGSHEVYVYTSDAAAQEHGGRLRRADDRGRRQAHAARRDPRRASRRRPAARRPTCRLRNTGIYGFVDVRRRHAWAAPRLHGLNQDEARRPAGSAASRAGTAFRPAWPLEFDARQRAARKSSLRRPRGPSARAPRPTGPTISRRRASVPPSGS